MHLLQTLTDFDPTVLNLTITSLFWLNCSPYSTSLRKSNSGSLSTLLTPKSAKCHFLSYPFLFYPSWPRKGETLHCVLTADCAQHKPFSKPLSCLHILNLPSYGNLNFLIVFNFQCKFNDWPLKLQWWNNDGSPL